jgi:hypothetical protein
MGGWLLLLILGFALPVFLVITIFWIWMLVSAVTNKGLGDGEKVGWVLAVIFLHLLGAILYFFIGHPKRKLPLGA